MRYSCYLILGIALLPAFVWGPTQRPAGPLGCGRGNWKDSISIAPTGKAAMYPSSIVAWPVACRQRQRIFDELVQATGLHRPNLRLMEVDQKRLAIYVKTSDFSYILYNYDDFESVDSLAFAGSVAHEIGHCLNHHEDFLQDSDRELDADYFLGFLLQKLGYTKTQVVACLSLLREGGDAVHPPTAKRKTSILNGYRNAAHQGSALAFSSANPRVVWTDSACCVRVADTLVTADRQVCPWTVFRNTGVFYDSLSNATYELKLNVVSLQNKYTGLGRLVNNRTSFTYLKTGRNAYQIYNRGKLVMRRECDDPNADNKLGFYGDGPDYLIHCLDDGDKRKKYLLLKDYRFAATQQLLPAILVTDPAALGR